MPVLDASVCVSLFRADDPGHQASLQWLERALQGDELIVSPVILLAEVAAALGRGLGDTKLSRQVVELLRARQIIDLLPVHEALAGRAAEVAAEQKVRGCNAIYVALAEQLEMELVTLDRQQLERVAEVVVTRNP
ncbi:MAG TPA: type II toxin-antitoxin system VapC family toxin [Thermoanaerobaculia bacterium]|jgi:predicted nucleic acid-binding protein|nr:type II toxin-antitoxin system VapC family toxin [Thermoanaerobaculia bacterium]